MLIRSIASSVLAAACLIGSAAPVMAAATPSTLFTPFPAPVSQVVEVDGRFLIVDLTINRFVGGAPGPTNPSTTTVSVNITAVDGAQVPVGLQAIGVRFEKLRGINRFFFTPLYPLATAVPLNGLVETDVDSYQGDMSQRSSVQYMRAVIRLENDGDVIKVPMGVVRVTTVLAP